ncbi:MAG: hypothetical protein JKX78_10850 [Alteromonadaceae bacterium]|nr:hypothetical protein [Alteromonadaceae bacterium]
MKILKLCTLLYFTISTASYAQDKGNIELAFSNLGSCLNEVSTKEIESGQLNPVSAISLLTSVYKNIAYEAGSIKKIEEKYIKLYQLANTHCSERITVVKDIMKKQH